MNLTASRSLDETSSYQVQELVAPVAVTSDHSEGTAGSDSASLRLLAMITLAQRAGKTCLPVQLGLAVDAAENLFSKLVQVGAMDKSAALSTDPDDLRQTLLDLRIDEWQEIRELLVAHRAGRTDVELWLANIVAAGCLGSEHLWRDLGLAHRGLLSALFSDYFPALAAKNTQDMKWKKFLYKQLCEQEGGYVCRAPSCAECAAYDDCFGPEV